MLVMCVHLKYRVVFHFLLVQFRLLDLSNYFIMTFGVLTKFPYFLVLNIFLTINDDYSRLIKVFFMHPKSAHNIYLPVFFLVSKHNSVLL